MGKLLEVREFDTITCNPDYRNAGNFRYMEKGDFDSLVSFIREYAGDGDNSDALEFMRIGYKRNLGEVVTFRNYVGIIQMKNGMQVQVLPKIDLGGGADDAGGGATKRVFLQMLRAMKDFPGKAFHDAALKTDRMNLYELFISMYLQEVGELVKHGLKSSYVNMEGNLNSYRGKLLVARHVAENLVHKERFYISFDEFHPDRPENRLVKSTLLKLQKLTGSAENSREIRQLLNYFEMVSESSNYEGDFSKVVNDRTTSGYRALMEWSRVFLTDRGFTTFTGRTVARALLFPMESVYESFVAREMRKAMCPGGWEVDTQQRGHYLFSEPRRQFALRPDIVLKRGSRTVIMDTKWKRLYDNAQANYGISQGDMYQMYAYSKKYGTREVWLLYPVNEDMRGHEPIRFASTVPGTGERETVVSLFFVDVARIGESLAELRGLVEAGEPLQ